MRPGSQARTIAVLALISIAAIGLTPTRASAVRPTCHGKKATVVGSERADVLRGTPQRDVMVGLRGGDVMKGLEGDDIICGGPGADRLLGGKGDDWLNGGVGTDRLSGGDGANTCLNGETNVDCVSVGQRERVNGTWVLLQVGSTAQVNDEAGPIRSALEDFRVRGLSLRVPWNVLSDSLLDAGKALADASGRAYSIRFIAGRHTPRAVFDSGSPYYMVNGEKVPTPFYPDGSPNTVFETYYERLVEHLAGYSRSRGIPLLHLPWYGQDWAELNNGKEVRDQPGYTEEAFINAHKRLVDIALQHAGSDLAVEFPMSGSGPLERISGALTDHIVARAGANSSLIYVQANGLGPNGDWGAPSPTVEQQMDAAVFAKAVLRGEQMIQPGDYDWAAVYENLIANGADYVEVYLPSFSGASADELAAQITDFNQIVAGLPD